MTDPMYSSAPILIHPDRLHEPEQRALAEEVAGRLARVTDSTGRPPTGRDALIDALAALRRQVAVTEELARACLETTGKDDQ